MITLVQAGPVAFAGFLNLDEIIPEFHGIASAVHEVFVQLVRGITGMSARKVGQYVHSEPFAPILVQVSAEEVPRADAFQFKGLDVLHQPVHKFAKGDDRLTGIGTVHFIQKIHEGVVRHSRSPRFQHLRQRRVSFAWRRGPEPRWNTCC